MFLEINDSEVKKMIDILDWVKTDDKDRDEDEYKDEIDFCEKMILQIEEKFDMLKSFELAQYRHDYEFEWLNDDITITLFLQTMRAGNFTPMVEFMEKHNGVIEIGDGVAYDICRMTIGNIRAELQLSYYVTNADGPEAQIPDLDIFVQAKTENGWEEVDTDHSKNFYKFVSWNPRASFYDMKKVIFHQMRIVAQENDLSFDDLNFVR